jgi:hypothetical protein
MANVYTVSSQGIPFAASKCMLGIFNGTGSGKVIRVYRIVMTNAQTTAVTGVNTLMYIQRLTTGSGGLPVLIMKHDSSSPTLPPQVYSAFNMDFTATNYFRRFYWSSDEPVASDAQNIDEFQTVPSIATIWDSSGSYLVTTVEPIVCREGYGLAVICGNAYTAAAATTPPTGAADFFIEFTAEST